MIDNYDSFTFNLVQYLSMCGPKVEVVRNDALTVDDVIAKRPDLVVISPGPGRPEDSGICIDLILRAPEDLPIFGVCLGFQGIVSAFGGKVIHAPYLMHGKVSSVHHDGKGVFHNMPQDFSATRYHSLMAERDSLPSCLQISAETQDGIVMGIRHREKRIEGVQFHPESYLTENGLRMIKNLLA